MHLARKLQWEYLSQSPNAKSLLKKIMEVKELHISLTAVSAWPQSVAQVEFPNS